MDRTGKTVLAAGEDTCYDRFFQNLSVRLQIDFQLLFDIGYPYLLGFVAHHLHGEHRVGGNGLQKELSVYIGETSLCLRLITTTPGEIRAESPMLSKVTDIVGTMLASSDGLFIFDLCHIRMFDYWDAFKGGIESYLETL